MVLLKWSPCIALEAMQNRKTGTVMDVTKAVDIKAGQHRADGGYRERANR